MQEITAAIAARRAQIKTLQRDINALQRAASALAGRPSTTATASPRKTASQATATPKVTQKGRGMSAAARKAVSKRMKAYWAGRKRANG